MRLRVLQNQVLRVESKKCLIKFLEELERLCFENIGCRIVMNKYVLTILSDRAVLTSSFTYFELCFKLQFRRTSFIRQHLMHS